MSNRPFIPEDYEGPHAYSQDTLGLSCTGCLAPIGRHTRRWPTTEERTRGIGIGNVNRPVPITMADRGGLRHFRDGPIRR
jgi:hypothetical protein